MVVLAVPRSELYKSQRSSFRNLSMKEGYLGVVLVLIIAMIHRFWVCRMILQTGSTYCSDSFAKWIKKACHNGPQTQFIDNVLFIKVSAIGMASLLGSGVYTSG
jgi:hypothetical protein